MIAAASSWPGSVSMMILRGVMAVSGDWRFDFAHTIQPRPAAGKVLAQAFSSSHITVRPDAIEGPAPVA
jgi:hypothetical protein